MSYTLAADVYLGDVSSQICEFLVKPRPCLFANPHHVEWQTDPCYAAWHLGPVFESVDTLDRHLKQAIESHPRYRALQADYFRQTFDLSAVSSSHRAAQAIADFLRYEPATPTPPTRQRFATDTGKIIA